MRTAFLSFLFVIVITTTAQARLGETPDMLVQRYGQPLSEADQKAEGIKVALAAVVFQKGGYEIDVTVVDGVSVQEVFKKINGDALSVAEIRTLLNLNSQGQGWEAPRKTQEGKRWARDDGATAQVSDDGSLTIKSKTLIAKESAAKKVEKTPSLDGF